MPRPIRDVFSTSTPRIVAAAALRMSNTPMRDRRLHLQVRVIHDEGRHAEPGTASHERAFPSAFVAPRPFRSVAAARRRRRRVEAAALEASCRRHVGERVVRQLHLEADLRRPGAVRNGIGIAVDRTGNRLIRNIEAVASSGVVDVLPLVRVANAGGRREPGRQCRRSPVRTPRGWSRRRAGRAESGIVPAADRPRTSGDRLRRRERRHRPRSARAAGARS